MRNYREFTLYSSDTETVFIEEDGCTRKVAEWRLISDRKMEYIKYRPDGSVDHRNEWEGDDIPFIWGKYHQRKNG